MNSKVLAIALICISAVMADGPIFFMKKGA